jgi:hypothetical protein
MAQPEHLEPPDEPEPEPTVAYPVHSIRRLAELLGEVDEFLRSGNGVTVLLTEFMTHRGDIHPEFTACNMIDDLSFTAYAIRCLTDDLLNEES